ncbi:hypothetical protein LSTR_LSTR011085 [Laodelphax striatellus]|uniref:Uncharacterized protein n=1 Tax=Laodelphax striatellus TaxID=195883 RepID=A0A482WVJ1_LAOST|nr:hypothetical protein LSTR_LSTR011085 [Laodelphax striatellus]
MRNLVEILCFTQMFHLSYLQAAPDNPRLPKLGPTIVEKPFKIDEDLSLIINGVDKFVRTEGNVSDLVTLNGMDKKHVTRANVSDLLTSRTYKQRMQLAKAYELRTNLSLEIAVNIINGVSGGDEPYTPLFHGIGELLSGYVQNSLNRGDWTYMSILCTSSAPQLTMLNQFQYRYEGNHLDPSTWKYKKTLDELIHLKMKSWKDGKKVISAIIKDNWSSPQDLDKYVLYGVFRGNTGNSP